MNAAYWSIYSKTPTCYPYLIRGELRTSESILDLGCGSYPLKAKIGLDFKKSVGVEIVPEKTQLAKRYLDDVIVGDIRSLDFDENSFNAVVAIDVIEHFEKSEALELLECMLKWSSKKVVITIPNGKTPGFVDPELPEELVEFQRHKCGFSPQELRKLGFRVYGIRGLQSLRDIRKRFPFMKLCSLVSQPFCMNNPEYASGLLGVK